MAGATPGTRRVVKVDRQGVNVFDTGGSGPTAVLVPDGPCVADHFVELISILSPEFRVICIEMPGNGGSLPSLGYDYAFATGGHLLNEVISQLRIYDAVLSASCVNSHYALSAGATCPDRWVGIVLHQAIPIPELQRWGRRTLPGALNMPILGQLVAAIYRNRMTGQWFHKALPPGISPTHLEAVAAERRRLGSCFCIASLCQAVLAERDPSGTYRDLASPVHLICGTADPTHRGTDWDSLARLLPNCSVSRLDGVGHFPEIERAAVTAASLKTLVYG
jgi:pimeloyl-ACP methyl ester carboxylesterase